MFRQEDETEQVHEVRDFRRIAKFSAIFVTILFFMYFLWFNDSSNNERSQNVIKVKTNVDESTIYYHNKTYVHPSFSLPQISLKLLDETNIFIESSSLYNVGTDYVLSWMYKEDFRIHFRPYNKKYGLLSISVCKSMPKKGEGEGNYTYFGLIRAHRSVCETNTCNSWTCQKDYDYFNKAYDVKYCILVVKSNRLNDILHFTHDFLKENKVPHTELNVGMFCGNPLIARSANDDKDVYFVNFNTSSQNNLSPFFICKFSTLIMDVNECFNTEIVSTNLNLPLMLIHDPTTDVIMTANYNPENKNLNLLTFNSNRLSFKAAFRSIPAPSGKERGKIEVCRMDNKPWEELKGEGDSAPYEVLGVYDTGTSKEKYHNLYI
ncbi:conserved hypothetical protein [Theileria orientalis strain Shintoku]|uniref:Uncharacterized protein n=1 Tax=Theileria orientalis strain Shintoku TaxID=869250 RepID=J4CDZ8_THEOR|nr:conserved hypothetical protein [Theileria orientalis strain Shintoku]BAM42017.1 conserved hypothetical protein [Theileria orientalis strain Shintoku]|eukprot:XP_009692318.1 conserved hypothetical protein [Theileria orientalis strain Shintoku]